MKRCIIKYSLEIFSAVVLILTLINLLFFPQSSLIRRLTNGFAIMAVLHEFEEKRIPGGFFELMAKKFGISEEQSDLDLASLFVILYWTVILGLSYTFEDITFFFIMPVVLGFFEAFVHTMGIWLHHMKKPYTPGLASAWWMAILSGYSVYCLQSNELAAGTDYLIGSVLMSVGFALMDKGVLYACKMTFADVRNNIRSLL